MSGEGSTQNPTNSQDDTSRSSTSSIALASRLKLVREFLGISQRELAKRAGVTNSSISMIELGQVSPSIQSLERILSVIPIELSEFFGFNPLSGVLVKKPVEVRGRESIDNAFLPVNQLSYCSLHVPVGGVIGPKLFEYEACGVVLVGGGRLRSISCNNDLNKGDSFYIPAKRLCMFENIGDIPFQIFICSFSG